MVIAENVLNTPINDLNASADDPQLSNGLSSMTASSAAVADPDVSECYTQYSLDASENANCGLRGTEGYTGTDGAWSQSYNPNGDGRSDLRMHMLSNGEVVWDLAGNVYQWTSNLINIGVYFEAEGYYDSISIYSSHSDPYQFTPWRQPSQSRSFAYGFGYYISGDNGTYVALRGGLWVIGANAGVFNVADSAPSDATAGIGFRCVYEQN